MSENENSRYSSLRFARESVSFTNPTVKTPNRYSKTQITSYLENPYKYSSQLQEVSSFLRYNNGLYNRIIKYFSGLPTFDYMLYPLEVDGKASSTGEKLQKSYLETASYVQKVNPKYNFQWFLERLLTNGELYLYKIEDKQSIVYKEMPADMCRIVSIEDNVCKYAVDLKKINTKGIYESMPEELQKLGDRYNEGGIKAEDLIDSSWYELEKNAYAFNLISQFLAKGFPPLLYLFDGLMHVEEMKQLQFTSANANNLKIIHQKIPIDDNGELLIDYDLIQEYHSSTKRNLPDGIAITTNPLDLQALTLSRTGAEAINQRNDALESLYNDAGINSELFNGNKSTTEAIATGVRVDEMYVMSAIGMFENFLNYEITQNKKSSHWRVRMMRTTYFTKDEHVKRCRENLALGGSRLEFLAMQGFSPLEGLNTLKGERALGIDEIMIPQQTSHTMTTSNEGGRPTKQESDDTSTVAKTPEKEQG